MNAKLIRDAPRLAKVTKAVILYDRLESMLAANEIASRLPSRPDCGADWTVNSWRFDMLENGREGEKALGETSDSDLMIVTLENAKPLLHCPLDWLARWAADHQNPGAALVLVLVGTTNRVATAPEVIAPLLRLAERCHLEFFIVDCIQAGADQRSEFRHWTQFSRWNHPARDLPANQPERRGVNGSTVTQQAPEFIQHPAETCSAGG
jgi:hypothetical protein